MIHWPYPSSPECHCPLVSSFNHSEFDSYKRSLPQCFWSEISQRVSVVFAPGPGHSSVRLILLPFSPLSPPSIHLCPLSLLPPSHSNSHWRRHLDMNQSAGILHLRDFDLSAELFEDFVKVQSSRWLSRSQ